MIMLNRLIINFLAGGAIASIEKWEKKYSNSTGFGVFSSEDSEPMYASHTFLYFLERKVSKEISL